jgi:hypothetical protein
LKRNLHRHFVPAKAKTDASACAWIAVDTQLDSGGIGLKIFLGGGARILDGNPVNGHDGDTGQTVA